MNREKLAFIFANIATQLYPFKIIPLQSTRKKNNRESEETLARAAVTVETERAKVKFLIFMMMMMMTTSN
jgi:hypothetical protein